MTRARYDRFLEKQNAMLPESGEIPWETKRKIIHAMLYQIRVKKMGSQILLYAGTEQIKAGEVIASPAESLNKKILFRVRFLT